MRIPSPSSRTGRRAYLTLFDLAWALVSPIVAIAMRDIDLLQTPDWHALGYFWLCSSGCAFLAFFAFRLQDGMSQYFSAHDAFDVLEAVLFIELMTVLALFTLTGLDRVPRSTPIIHGLLLFAGLVAARIVARVAFSSDELAPSHRVRGDRMIVIGGNRLAGSFIRLLHAIAPDHQPVVAILEEKAARVGQTISGVRVMGGPHELDAVIGEFAIHGVKIDRVVVAGEASLINPPSLHEIEYVCKRRHIELSYLPRLLGMTERLSNPIAAVTSLPEVQFPARSYFILKRWIDVIGCLVIMVLFSPMFVMAGALVFFDVGRPFLFWQERMGWRGRPFLIYKFRTLRSPFDPDGRAVQPNRQPSAIGRLLRTTRIDELPQLFNVLLGDMSLIGPRPLLPEDQPSNTAIRLSVRPGLSGWAQVNGGKLVSKEEKEKLDEWYVQNATLWIDLKIVWMTVTMMAGFGGSSEEARADAEQVEQKFASHDPIFSRQQSAPARRESSPRQARRRS